MAVRIQFRRGTAAEWSAANPILAAGELGYETDTAKFKLGNGTDNWDDLVYAGVNQTDIEDAVAAVIDSAPAALDTLNELAAALGDDANFASTIVNTINNHATATANVHGIANTLALVTLDILAGQISNSENNAANSLSTHAAQTTNIHGIANTLQLVTENDLQEGLSNLENTIETTLSQHQDATTNVHGIANTSELVTESDLLVVSNSISNILANISDIETEIGTKADLDSPSFTGTVVLPATTSIGGVSSLEIGYLNNVTSAIQTQLDSKANLNSPEFTGTVVLPNTVSIGDVSGLEISYLNNVTSSIQTQLDGKLATSVAATTYAALAGAEFTGNVVLTANTSIGTVDSTEISYLNGVTSSIQDQLDDKAPLESPTFTGTVSGVTKAHVGLGNVDNTADADKPVSTATQTALDAKLNLSGGTMTGALTLSGAPTSDLHAATKQYVDGLAAGINFHQPVVAATSGNLDGTYDNGTNGVGATLTKASNGSIGTIDGVTVGVGNRILLRAQTDKKQNGVYTITAVGSASAPWQITRATDADNNPTGELATGDFVFVTQGSTNGSKGFIVSSIGPITIGTDNVEYAQFNASEAVIAGTNIEKSGATISVISNPTFANVVTASSGVAFSDGTQTKVGVPSITTISQKTDSYTLSSLDERDTIIEISKSTATTLTIPANASVAYPVGTTLDIIQTGTGQVTIAGAGGVTVNATPGLKLRTQWSSATLLKRGENTWLVYGDLTA